MLFIMTFAFGVCLTQIVTEHKVAVGHHEMEKTPQLEELYGSLDRSMLYLYEAVSDGIHWNELLEPLDKHCSPWLALAFVGYMSFVFFSLMNIVTAFFVE